MEQERLYVEGEVLWTGVRKASSRSSKEPILCLVKLEAIQFVAVSGLRLVVSWEVQLRQPAQRRLAFVIPPTVADLLSCEVVRSQVGVEIALGGEEVTLRLADHLGNCEIRWKSELAAFPAPDDFSELIKVPQTLMDVPYLRISDTAHQAIAKLVRMESEKRIDRTKLAILIALDFGRLSLNGQEIVGTESSQYYFDPRLVIRALEFVKERSIRVGITPLKGKRRAYLSLLAKQEDWLVHCALLSIGRDTQKLYPLSPGNKR